MNFMKNILIPTDFSEESLNVLDDYLVSSDDDKINVLFFHAIKLSDSITDLLLLSRRTKEIEKIPQSFRNYCVCIQEEFSKVDTVKFQYFYGHTMAIFRNFMEANAIDLIVYDPLITLAKVSRSSINPYEIIDKSTSLKWHPSAGARQMNIIRRESNPTIADIYQ